MADPVGRNLDERGRGEEGKTYKHHEDADQRAAEEKAEACETPGGNGAGAGRRVAVEKRLRTEQDQNQTDDYPQHWRPPRSSIRATIDEDQAPRKAPIGYVGVPPVTGL